MDSKKAGDQIQIMIGFIRQEAQERASDIKREADNEANSRKLEKERVKTAELKDEFARKKKEKVVSQRIERSRRSADSRVEKMRARDNIIKTLRDVVVDKLSDVAGSAKYPDLLRFLIAQGLMIITENKVIVQCRKEDLALVKAQMPAAIKLYQDFIAENTSVVPKVSVDISNDFLPPAPQKGKKGLSCCGGVVLSARNGSIVCRNTLDSRLDLCFDQLIPQIRGMLFGVRAKFKREEVTGAPVHGH